MSQGITRWLQIFLFNWILNVQGYVVDFDHTEHIALQNGCYILVHTHTLVQDPKDLLPNKMPFIWMEKGEVVEFQGFSYSRNVAGLGNLVRIQNDPQNHSVTVHEFPVVVDRGDGPDPPADPGMELLITSLPQVLDLLDGLSRLPLNQNLASRVKDPFTPAYFKQTLMPDESFSAGYVIPESQLYFILLVDSVLHLPQSWHEELHPDALRLSGTIVTGTPINPPAAFGTRYKDSVHIATYLPSNQRGLQFALWVLSATSLLLFLLIINAPLMLMSWDRLVGVSSLLFWRRKHTLPRLYSSIRYTEQSVERYVWSVLFLIRSAYYSLGAYQAGQLATHGTVSHIQWLIPRLLSVLDDGWMIATLVILGTMNRHYRSHLNRKEFNMFSSLFVLYMYFGIYEAVTGQQFIFKKIIQACLILFLLIFDNLRYYTYRLRLERETLLGGGVRALNDYRLANIYSSFRNIGLLYIIKGSAVMSVQSFIHSDVRVSPLEQVKSNSTDVIFGDIGPNIIGDDWKLVFMDLMITTAMVIMALEARCFDKKELNPIDSRYSYMLSKTTSQGAHRPYGAAFHESSSDDAMDDSDHLLT